MVKISLNEYKRTSGQGVYIHRSFEPRQLVDKVDFYRTKEWVEPPLWNRGVLQWTHEDLVGWGGDRPMNHLGYR